MTALFAPYGDIESIRLVPRKRAAFVNFASIGAAMHAKEGVHGCLPLPAAPGAGSAANGAAPPKPLLLNFTSSQQNCMRARGESQHRWGDARGREGGGYEGRGMGRGMGRGFGRPDGRGRGGGYDARANGHGYAPRRQPAGPRARAAAERSRSLYLGSVPDGMSLAYVAAAVEPYGVVESLRMVRPKSCVFVNFVHEAVAVALQARYGGAAGDMADFGGARLNVNFAKARPCAAELLRQVDEGARRTLDLTLRAPASAAAVRAMLGEGRDALLGCEPQGEPAEPAAAEAAAAEPAAAAEAAEAAAADSPSAAAAGGAAYVRFVLDFSSIGGAIGARAALEAAAEPPAALEYVVAPVLSMAEIEAMAPRQADAAEGGAAEAGAAEAGAAPSTAEATRDESKPEIEVEAEVKAAGSADALAQPEVEAAAAAAAAAEGDAEVAAA